MIISLDSRFSLFIYLFFLDLIFEIILLMDFSSKIEFHFPLSTFGGFLFLV